MASQPQRAYRACVHCRRRKSKCIFDTASPAWLQGRPQCHRCTREGRRCVLAAPKKPSSSQGLSPPSVEASHAWRGDAAAPQDSRRCSSQDMPDVPPFVEGLYPSSSGPANSSEQDEDFLPAERTVVDAPLQNPGDALNILARVAHDADPGETADSREAEVQDSFSHVGGNTDSPSDTLVNDPRQCFLHDLGIPLATARNLVLSYKEKYHQFLPIANNRVLDPAHVQASALAEPHLMAAILTVASRQDNDQRDTYEVCSDYMRRLIADLVYTGAANVEAVEAVLILAEWTPQRFQSRINVGTGEEDRAAWMQVGLAVRLAYLQDLDSTSFMTHSEGESEYSVRRRVAWAACYTSDRLISTRVGKAFWSRGPGPASTFGFEDYAPFKLQGPEENDYASIFQANLDLTQLFSNAHDILYASLPHRDRLFTTGEYAKYIDDFRNVLASWHAKWGSLNCSAGIKCGLVMSYEYLRLYITAFAYQATLHRTKSRPTPADKTTPSNHSALLAKTIATTPDARFIYEAVSAAKSLLSTFNTFVHPTECLRYMPMRYYLYVIYAAVFLYKAKATGLFQESKASKELKRMLYQVVTRLKQSSSNPDDPGMRYANLLALLWAPKVDRNHSGQHGTSWQDRDHALDRVVQPRQPSQDEQAGHPRHNMQPSEGNHEVPPIEPQLQLPAVVQPSFSWRDLQSVGQFATSRNDPLTSLLANFGTGPMDNPSLIQMDEISFDSSGWPEVDQWAWEHSPF